MKRFTVVDGGEPPRDIAERAVLALDAGGMVSWSWHLPSDAVEGDEGFRALWGTKGGRVTSEETFGAIHRDDVERVRGEVDASLTRDEDFVTEFRVVHADGSLRWVGARGRVMERDQEGNAVRFLGVNWDKTDAKLQEERMTLMAAEMNHRVENTFGVVAALVQIGARTSDDKASYAARLRGQIQALSEAHRLSALAARNAATDGADTGTVPASAILARALAAWMPEDEATRPDGQVTLAYRADPELLPKQAAALAMLAYELTTNAVKYGALGDPDGHLTVTIDDVGNGDARLRWTERCLHGLPRPSDTPRSSHGFGQVLLRHCAAMLRGNVVSKVAPHGLRVEAVFPAKGLESGSAMNDAATIAPGQVRAMLAG